MFGHTRRGTRRLTDDANGKPVPMSNLSARIGSRRFGGVVAALALLSLLVIDVRYRRLMKPDALVPLVTLTGPTEAIPGETVRYAVLARDRWGAPIPDAPVRLGFERHSTLSS